MVGYLDIIEIRLYPYMQKSNSLRDRGKKGKGRRANFFSRSQALLGNAPLAKAPALAPDNFASLLCAFASMREPYLFATEKKPILFLFWNFLPVYVTKG
jgi:hypothetical protein